MINKREKILIIILLIIIIFSLLFLVVPKIYLNHYNKKVDSLIAKNVSSESREACRKGGGSIERGSSSCGDRCSLVYKKRGAPPINVCTTDMSWICDCGPIKCWNGEKCIGNPLINFFDF